MMNLGLFAKKCSSSTAVMVINFGGKETLYALDIVSRLRNQGIITELYPDALKLGKQFAYANARKIPYVIIAGEEEMKNNECILKVMETGEQKKIQPEDIESYIKS